MSEKPSSGSTPFGLLGQLPQEIRDNIYKDVFSAGHISLARTSKALHENSKSAISEHGVYRVRFSHRSNYNDWDYVIHRQRHNADTPIWDYVVHPRRHIVDRKTLNLGLL